MKKKLIIFDYDGVIVDSLDINLEIAKQACEEIEHPNFPLKSDIEQLDTISFEELGRQIGLPQDKTTLFADHVFKLLVRNTKVPHIFSGIDKVIQKLGDKNQLAIITTNVKCAVDQVLEKEKLQDKVHLVMGAEKPGSKSEKIITAVREFKVTLGNTYMIGDAMSDILEAKKASVKSIAVTWGYHSREKLEKAMPDFLVNTPYEILPIVSSENLC